jgi:hypothetical protein
MQRAQTNLEIRISSKAFLFIIQIEEVVATKFFKSHTNEEK